MDVRGFATHFVLGSATTCGPAAVTVNFSMKNNLPLPHGSRNLAGMAMRTPTFARATTLFDYETTDDCFSDAGLAATKLGPDEQLTRFLHWLQFTDRGLQPS
jgi:hypothetical protein